MAKNLAIAYYNLSIMLDAGMPILKALDTTTAGSKGVLKKAFSALSKGTSAGNSLAETMKKFPWIFALWMLCWWKWQRFRASCHNL